jgi:glycine/D-amino acid oxidase-like deaminating enzyme
VTLTTLPDAGLLSLWLDSPDRPAPRPPLAGELDVDLAVVGGGFTGLWAALLALQEEPGRSVVVVEGARLGWAASGRNGGFCAASLTHGLGNGLARWPDELPALLRLGHQNLDGIAQTLSAHGIDCGFERTGALDVAVAPWQVTDLREVHEQARRLGEDSTLLGAEETRSLVSSPTYLGGVLDRTGTAMVDPARLVWGLARVVEQLGGRIVESSPVTSWRNAGDRVVLRTGGGMVRAAQVVLATNVFPSLVKRARPYVVPVWDHVLATEPLTPEQLSSLGWEGRQGVGDAGNQFHYYRLSPDNRLVWGGYDALYYFGSDLSSARSRSARTEQMLARHLVETFPQLDGVRFSHTWGGAIDTCTRFSPFWGRAMNGRVAYVAGFTGLGVGSSRFGAQVCLDLLAGRDNERTRLSMVRRKPLPFPPEPLRWAAIQLTRRSIARADATEGRRDVWLRTLDRLGLGFDS